MENKSENNKVLSQLHDLYEDKLRLERIDPYEAIIKKSLSEIKNKDIK